MRLSGHRSVVGPCGVKIKPWDVLLVIDRGDREEIQFLLLQEVFKVIVPQYALYPHNDASEEFLVYLKHL